MSSIMASYPVSSLPLEKFSKLHSGPALEKLSDKIRVPLHAVKSSLEGRVVAALTAAAITLSILSCYFKLSRPGKETPSSRLLSSNDEYSACEMDLFSEVPTLLATQSEKGMKIFHQESVVTGGSTAAPSVRDQDGTIPEQAHSRPQFDSVLSTEIEGSTEAKVPYRADGGQGDQRVDDEAWVHFYTQVYDPDMRGAPLSEAWRHGVKFWDLSSHPTYSYVHPHEGHKGFRPIGDDGGFGYLKLRNVSSSSESTDLPSPLSLLSQSTQTISLPSSAQHVDGKVDVTRKTERSKRRAQRGTRKVAIPMAGPGETGRVPFEPLLPALDVSLISSRSLIVTQPQKETALSHLGVDGQEESKDLSFPLTPIGLQGQYVLGRRVKRRNTRGISSAGTPLTRSTLQTVWKVVKSFLGRGKKQSK